MPTIPKEPLPIITSPEAEPPAAPPPAIMPLQQWCEIKSQSLGRSVEILSGFFRAMRKRDVDNLPPSEWETRYQQYKTAPAGRGK